MSQDLRLGPGLGIALLLKPSLQAPETPGMASLILPAGPPSGMSVHVCRGAVDGLARQGGHVDIPGSPVNQRKGEEK